MKIEKAYILKDPQPPAPEGFTVVGVVIVSKTVRRTDFYYAGSEESANNLISILNQGNNDET